MKTITIQVLQEHLSLPGRYLEQAVIVNWFPGRTEEQIMANVVARVYGQPIPYPDPNLITIRLDMPDRP